MSQTNPTLDDVWRLFQETDRKFQETDGKGVGWAVPTYGLNMVAIVGWARGAHPSVPSMG